MAEVVRLTKVGKVGVIAVDNPPVNALSAAVREGLLAKLHSALAEPSIQALVLLGAGRTFIAGADIREFDSFDSSGGPDLNEINAAYETSPKPIVAAIHGTALGGGLEIALACHYRVGLARAQVGLPEVKLGLLPGAGGTQRLPRLIGAAAALPLIARGNFVPGPKAKELGILDQLIEGDVQAGAVSFAEELVARNAPLKRIRDLAAKAEPRLFADFRKEMAREAKGFFAPWKCIDCVELTTTTPFDEGLRRERALFRECLASKQAKAQIHVFFAEREVAKIPDVPRDTPVQPFAKAAVVGAGTMGGGIAMCFANAGIPVTVLEVNREALERGLAVVARNYAGTVARGRLTQAEMDRRMALIQGTTDYAALADADFLIEAVFEEMEIKREVFRRLGQVAKPTAILASNTSTLDIDAMAAESGRPRQFIGTHFFSPANVMRLLEVVRGAQSSRATIATAMELGRKLGKVAVLVGNCDGFVGNRMLAPYVREAEFLLEEGALPQQIDKVFVEFGLAMGPFTMGDLAGVDVGWRIEKRRRQTRSKNLRTSYLVDKIAERGRHGQKTGAGWYRYESGSRQPLPDPEVERIVVEHAREIGLARRPISDEEIFKRCFYPLINEGVKCLEEGMAIRASDIDIIYVNGYGMPAYLGGPMWQAEVIGLRAIHDDIRRFQDRHGGYWEPAGLLSELAASSGRLRDWRR
ncbi:MAG: 3-hydroxyacyl-CoA dehydrogenase [Alphaproteobacteria bacterium]|nr:3-hydroxyacyl-CoA dehydrogenase [Alphaproteobacteria bacterium]